MNHLNLNGLKLNAELKQFGLNPSEWSLQRIQSLTYLIQNKFDKNFTLWGQIEFKKQKPQWKSVEVFSL